MKKTKQKKTKHRFKVYGEIKDSYSNKITVQESSAAFAHRCWIFVRDHKNEETHWVNPPGYWQAVSAHLSPVQARRVAEALLKFADEAT